ncbi:MAG: beta-N-acetylhexosaminidase [Myxococcales bacterium]|nr:beta-N-acetylhexosaminidase [Myxococcales bacterium]
MTRLSHFDRLAGAAVVGAYPGLEVPPEALTALREGRLAGLILFRRNLGPIEHLLGVTRALSEAHPADLPPPLVAVDQEGGRVARLGAPVVKLPPMRHLGQHDDLALTERAAAVLGAELSALGFNLDFAPVCDVDSNPANPVIGDRAFSADPARVARHAAAFARGLQSQGVAGCAKHFPGHGDTSADSHLELPVLGHDLARLEAVELPPFRALFEAGVASVMTAHVQFDALDPTVPATLSKRVISGLLRAELAAGRDDLVIVSDDLLMNAVSARFSVAEAAVRSVSAGCDLVLVCTTPEAAEEARRALSEAAQADPDFAQRLGDAARRVTAMRARFQAKPVQHANDFVKISARPVRALLESALQQIGGSSIDAPNRGGVE